MFVCLFLFLPYLDRLDVYINVSNKTMSKVLNKTFFFFFKKVLNKIFHLKKD